MQVGFNDDGIVTALDVQLFSNGGYSLDLSAAVMDRAISNTDGSYYVPNVRVIGRVCRTNLPTNTAFRGFGGPQVRLLGTLLCHFLCKCGNSSSLVGSDCSPL